MRVGRLSLRCAMALVLMCVMGCEKSAAKLDRGGETIRAMEAEIQSFRKSHRQPKVEITDIIIKYITPETNAAEIITHLEKAGFIVDPDNKAKSIDGSPMYIASKEVCAGKKYLTHFCDEDRIIFDIRNGHLSDIQAFIFLNAL